MMLPHNSLTVQKQQAGGELARVENEQIAEVAETATEIAGNDWGDPAKNPLEDVGAAMDAIQSASEKKYYADFVEAHFRVWIDFFSNPFVRGVPGLKQSIESESPMSFPVPGLPGVTGYSTQWSSNNIAIVGCRKAPALVFIDGPTEVAIYRVEPAGYDAYLVRQWLEPKLAVPSAIRKLTGVHVA